MGVAIPATLPASLNTTIPASGALSDNQESTDLSDITSTSTTQATAAAPSSGSSDSGISLEKLTPEIIAAELSIAVLASVVLISEVVPTTASAKETSSLDDFTALKKDFDEGKIDQATYEAGLGKVWVDIYDQHDPQTWLTQAAILDEIDTQKLTPILFEAQPDYLINPTSKVYVPLVEYSHLSEFNKSVDTLLGLPDKKLQEIGLNKGDGNLKPESRDKLIAAIQDNGGAKFKFFKETSKTGAVLEAIYSQRILSPLKMNWISRIITFFLGKSWRQTTTPDAIAKTALGLGITPYEIVDDGNGNRVFRGPKFLFGKSLSEYSTFNNFFTRDLTTTARSQYVAEAINQNAKLLSGVEGIEDPYLPSAVVISSADARLRFQTLALGHADDLQWISGKVFTPNAVQIDENKGDNPVYYEGKYYYRVSDALNIKTKSVGSVVVSEEADIKAYDIKLPLTSANNVQSVQHAQTALLNALFTDMNGRGVIQNTQRLAPADVHNYVSSVNGTALSNLEAAKLMEGRLAKLQGQLKNPPDAQKASIQKQIEDMKEIQTIFAEQEKQLGRASSSTIDISGTSLSVAENAVANQANILATNNRKVMIIKHAGLVDTYSVHIFIGATGVDQVRVGNSGNTVRRQGDWQGDMAAGGESVTTYDNVTKLTSGQALGKFPITGSTVQSFYFSDEFKLTDDVQNFQNSLGKIELNRLPEIKAQMGNVILQMEPALLAQVKEIAPPAHAIAAYMETQGWLAIDAESLNKARADNNLKSFWEILDKNLKGGANNYVQGIRQERIQYMAQELAAKLQLPPPDEAAMAAVKSNNLDQIKAKFAVAPEQVKNLSARLSASDKAKYAPLLKNPAFVTRVQANVQSLRVQQARLKL